LGGVRTCSDGGAKAIHTIKRQWFFGFTQRIENLRLDSFNAAKKPAWYANLSGPIKDGFAEPL